MNEFTKSGFSISFGRNIYRRSSGLRSIKTILILAFTFFALELYAQPVITTFSPQSGPAGTVVTITGSGFSLAPSLNVVFFGAYKVFVSASTSTSLTVTAPTGSNYQYISITNVETGLTVYSSVPFNFTFPGGCKPEFAAKVDFTSGTNPYSVSFCDMDNNGKPDLAVTNFGSNTVSVYYNISVPGTINAGSFAAKVDYVTGSSPKSVSFGDIDGDGRPDMIVTNSGDTSVSVFRNTSTFGNVSFAARVNFPSGGSPWSVSVGDVNGDGKPDLAVANRVSWTVTVLRNTSTSGAISFLPKVDYATGSSPYSVSIGDLDGDGKPDLAVANSGSNTASVFKNTSTSGAISFAAKVDFTAGSGPLSVSIGDIDGDGKLDLAVANNGSNDASVFRNTSTPGIINAGSFAAKVDFPAGGAPQIISIGDIDGDGKPDLAVANFTGNSVSVLRNTSVSGTVSFAAKVDLTTAGQASSVSICDIDGDTKPDVTATNYSTNSLSVFRNISTPAVLQASASGNGNPITNGSITTSITNFTDFGNVNSFGNLIRTYSFQNTSTDSLAVDSIKMSGADPGSFAPGSITPAGKIAPGASKSFTVTYVLSALGVKNATVNIYSSINSGTVCLLQQNYTFAVKANQIPLAPVITTFSPQSGPAGTTVNITGSGFNTTPSNNVVFFGAALASVSACTDTSLTVNAPAGSNYKYISVTNLGSNLTGYSSTPFLLTFPGGCKTEFAARVNFSTGTTPYSISIGDLDGDGKSDLAVANYASNTVSVFRNTSTTGGVSFAAKVDFATGSSPKSVCIGEIDGDGKPDLAVTNSASNSVSVFRNTSTTGGVSFAAKVDFGTGSSPWSVSLGDLNGDGKTDLAVANRVSSTVSVLRNTSTSGGVSFAAKVDFSAGSSPYSVSMGDIDGDGKPDLAVANNGPNTASVYQNTSTSGGISFAAKVDFSAGSGPISISIGDIDGDGKPDLAVANNSGNNASVFRNTSTPGIIDAGSFAARVDFAAGGAPQIVSIGDIDGDGKPDLAVANFTGSSVSVLRNTSLTGTVSFSAKVDLGSAGQASSVSIGDLDGDGKPEIAAPNYNVNSVSVFRNIALPAALQTAASGNGNPITNGSVTTSLTNLTDFGNVSTGGSLNRTYTFQNTSTDSLSVDSIKITGTDSVLFTVGSLTPPGKIASGGSKTFNVTFSPNSSGIKNATVRVYSNINSGTYCLLQQTYTFAISGTGFASVQTNALNFDGTNDYVALPNELPTAFTGGSTTEFTIEYWFKGTSFQSAVRIQNGSGYIVAGWNGKHIISSDGGTLGGVNVGAGVTDGNWHHIAFTWKKNTANGFRSYLDGALVQQINSANVNLPLVTSGGYLGAYNGASEFMNGTLDEVRIWTRELSQTEISTNRFIQINSGTGLLASYHFNQGIGGGNNTGITTLTDATSNNYAGTLNNFALNGPASNFVGSGPGLIPASSEFNITLIPEGLYDAGTDRLRLRDTARAYLHSNISPFGVVDSAVTVIDSVTYTGSFIFANAPSGTYYIRMNHRNSIETWSKTGGESFVQGTTMSYDFTTAGAQAYGNNMVSVDVSPVRYAVYSGDVNQNGTIDLNDIISVYNAASGFSSGYVVNDVNGDNFVDLNDILITYNNSAGFVAVVRP